MAVIDLWLDRRRRHTKRYGRGLRWRVTVKGWPTQAFPTRKEAELVNADRLTTPPPSRGGADTVGVLLERWRDSKRDLSKGGYSAVKTGCGHAAERWGAVAPGDVETVAVRAWLAELTVRKRVGGRWVDVPAGSESKIKARNALRGALQIEVDAGRLSRNPCAGVRVAQGGGRRAPRFLTAVELGRLAAECGSYAPMVWLLGTTGVRVGECCRLDVGDVDVARRRLDVRRAKGGEPREVPVPASVLGMLTLEGRGVGEPLFTSPLGVRVNQNNWRPRVFVPAARRAGLGGLHVHDLRHTAASLMIRSGATVKDVQAALGHRSAKMTLDLYAGWWADGLDDVGARMDRLLRPSGGG